jgi:ATP-binding cassette, subfamily B, bacterial
VPAGAGQPRRLLPLLAGQRAAIARAFLKNAPTPMFDEATSHLDAVSEAQVRGALDALMRDRTTIVIAHRRSMVRNADFLAVLDQGCVVEAGSHPEPLARGGLYARLIRRQLAGASNRSGWPGISAAAATIASMR